VAILDGAAMVAQFAPQRIDRDDVWALIPKIVAQHEPAFDRGPATRGATRLTVAFADGSTEEAFVPVSKTMSEPLDRARAIAKFETLTEGIVSDARRAKILGTVLGLERLDDIAQLVEPLAAPVGAAFA
jgi:2-methylcitrate dehydratase PrpD